jgi:hypothetical protein
MVQNYFYYFLDYFIKHNNKELIFYSDCRLVMRLILPIRNILETT